MKSIKRFAAGAAIAALALTGAVSTSVVSASHADAASYSAKKVTKAKKAKKVTTKVYIYSIGSKKTVTGNNKVLVKAAKVAKSKNVKVISSKLTVKQGKKFIARNAKSVKLKAGSYKVTSIVKYKVKSGKKYSKTKTKTKNQIVKVIKKVVKKPVVKTPAKTTPTKVTSARLNTDAGKRELVSLLSKARAAKGLSTLSYDTRAVKLAHCLNDNSKCADAFDGIRVDTLYFNGYSSSGWSSSSAPTAKEYFDQRVVKDSDYFRKNLTLGGVDARNTTGGWYMVSLAIAEPNA